LSNRRAEHVVHLPGVLGSDLGAEVDVVGLPRSRETDVVREHDRTADVVGTCATTKPRGQQRDELSRHQL
jgi:hypothetical protein